MDEVDIVTEFQKECFRTSHSAQCGNSCFSIGQLFEQVLMFGKGMQPHQRAISWKLAFSLVLIQHFMTMYIALGTAVYGQKLLVAKVNR